MYIEPSIEEIVNRSAISKEVSFSMNVLLNNESFDGSFPVESF